MGATILSFSGTADKAATALRLTQRPYQSKLAKVIFIGRGSTTTGTINIYGKLGDDDPRPTLLISVNSGTTSSPDYTWQGDSTMFYVPNADSLIYEATGIGGSNPNWQLRFQDV